MKDQKFKTRQEKRMIRKIYSILTRQRKWIVKNMQDLSFFEENKIKREIKTGALKITKNSVQDEIEAFIDKLPYKDELATEIVTFMRIALKRGGEQLIRELNMKSEYGISFDAKNERAVQFLRQKENWELSDRNGNIDGTTKNRLKEILIQSADQGINYDDTAEKIVKLSSSGVFSEARGRLIAVREIGVAYEEGNNEVIKQFQSKFPGRVVLKKWQTVNDSRVTPTHRQNQNMGWIMEQTVFEGTGDQTAPGSDNPRCRCFTKYKIPKKE